MSTPRQPLGDALAIVWFGGHKRWSARTICLCVGLLVESRSCPRRNDVDVAEREPRVDGLRPWRRVCETWRRPPRGLRLATLVPT